MSNREIFIDKLRQLSKEEMLERYIALLNTEKLTDCVSDLEAKLAESEIKNKESEIFYKREINRRDTKLRNIKQQLAEKEKEIEALKQRLKDTIKIYSDDFVEKDKELKELRFQARNIFPLVENLEDKVNQDKISFCIEKLNYLQDIIDNRVDEYLQSHDMDNYNCFVTHQGMYSCFEILVEEIDNQIKQLKEMK